MAVFRIVAEALAGAGEIAPTKSGEDADAFYLTLGVTAGGYSSAAEFAEKHILGVLQTDEPIVEMTITALNGLPDMTDVPILQDPELDGVHFRSGRILFNRAEECDA